MTDDHKPEIRWEREYWPNGQLQRETPYIGERITGLVRWWHENGALWRESPKVNSVDHGLMREWNEAAQLVLECQYDKGVGISKSWHPGGGLSGEMGLKNGNIAHGRLRVWDEGGDFLGEQFFVSGGQVSKKKYIEACAKDPSLPRYEPDGLIPLLDRIKEPPVAAPAPTENDYPDARDALVWLQESKEASLRTLGELPSAKASIELVKEFLAAGTVRVLAIEIERVEELENTGHLLIELPVKPAAKRKKALKFCNQQNQRLGFSRIKDTGQQFVHVALD